MSDALETAMDGTAALIGLTIAPEHRPGVLMNFRRAADLASLFTEFPLADHDEAAPIYCPGTVTP